MGLESPKVTVLMPVYNGERHLNEALDSVLNQTFKDFEFLIINDGSADESVKIIEKYCDARIRLVHNEKNLQLIATLNKGIQLARGEYIARMDCDDVCLPQRLEKQITFMDQHRDVGVCGSWISIFSEKSRSTWQPPTDSEEISALLFFDTGVAHPSVIMRTKYFVDNGLYYDPSFIHAEDYELWTRAIEYFKFANIPEILLCYRQTSGQISQIFNDVQKENATIVRLRQLQKLDITPDNREIEIHMSMMYDKSARSLEYLEELARWLTRIIRANVGKKRYIEPFFSNQLKLKWFHACYATACFRNPTWRVLRKSELYDPVLVSRADQLKLFMKSTLKTW